MIVSSTKQNYGALALDLDQEFRVMASTIANLARAHGIPVVPYRDARLPHFTQKNQQEKLTILDDLKKYLQICQLTLSEGGKLNDPITISWAAIRQLGLRPTSDLFAHITQDDVIEIHDSIGIQIFRNFNFYSYCNYGLEELHCYPWNHLYSRNDEVLHGILNLAVQTYGGEITKTTPTGLPKHVIEELYSPFRYKIEAEITHISPLYDVTNRVVATIVIEKGRLLGAPLTAEEEEGLLNSYLEKCSPLDLN